MKIRQLTHVKRRKNELGNYIYSARIMAGQFPTPETTRRMGTSFKCNDFWDCLGGQVLLMIGGW